MRVWPILLQAIVLGLGAGITPGPLLGLIINETLRGGWRAGVLVAIAPLIADAVIITLTFSLFLQFPLFIFPLLSIAGGCYVLFLGWETFQTPSEINVPTADQTGNAWLSLRKGIAVNMLNPHPYLFWLTVGGPLLSRLSQQSAWSAIVVFLGGFYSCLVGSKIVIAVCIHSGRTQLQGRGYRLALQGSGFLLLLFGGILLWGGIRELMATLIDKPALVVYIKTPWSHVADLSMLMESNSTLPTGVRVDRIACQIFCSYTLTAFWAGSIER